MLIVIADWSDLPYNSVSSDTENPWLINGYPETSKPSLRNKINHYWEQERVPAKWGIRPFWVHEWTDDAWSPLSDLTVDLENCVVRVTVKDQSFWCHPPRSFKVIENACKDEYKQKKGNFKAKLESMKNMKSIQGISEDRINDQAKKVQRAFNQLFSIVQELPWDDDKQLTSYRYPTLQMEADRQYQAGGQRDRTVPNSRFVGDKSGVFEANVNEAHYKFANENTEPKAKPTERDLWDWVVESLKIDDPPSYEDVWEEGQ